MKIKIGVFFGGNSVEHEVSILTALQVYNNIDKEKYNTELFYITKENTIITASNLNDIECYKKNDFKNKEEKTPLYFFVFFRLVRHRVSHFFTIRDTALFLAIRRVSIPFSSDISEDSSRGRNCL